MAEPVYEKRQMRVPKRPKCPTKWWWVGIAVLYLYSFPYFERIFHANELPRIYLVQAMVDHGELHIDRAIQQHGFTIDTARYGGHYYANKAPGMSFLGAPVYAIAKWVNRLSSKEPLSLRAITYLLRLFCVTLPSLLFLGPFVRMVRRFTENEAAVGCALVGYALGSMALPLSLNYMSHGPAAIALGLGFLALCEPLSSRRLFAAGFALAGSVLLEYQSAFLAAPLGLLALSRLLRTKSPPSLLSRLLAFAAGGAIPSLVLLFYHRACFGSVWATGYKYAAFGPFHALHSQGFLGLKGPTWRHFWLGVLAPSTGLFALSPFLLLGLYGIVLALRSREQRADAIGCAAIVVVGIFFYSSIVFAPGGWGVGPRYIAGVVPFLAAPAALACADLSERKYLRLLPGVLLVASVLLHVGSSLVFPHWPDRLTNPVVELAWPLVKQGFAPYNLGRLFLSPALSLWPAFAMAVVIVGAALYRYLRSTPATVAGLLLGCLFLTWFWLAPRSSQADAQHVWRFVTGIWEPRPEPP